MPSKDETPSKIDKKSSRNFLVKPTLKCPKNGCREIFFSLVSMNDHLEKSHSSNSDLIRNGGRFLCFVPGCNFSGTQKGTIINHLNDRHTKSDRATIPVELLDESRYSLCVNPTCKAMVSRVRSICRFCQARLFPKMKEEQNS